MYAMQVLQYRHFGILNFFKLRFLLRRC